MKICIQGKQPVNCISDHELHGQSLTPSLCTQIVVDCYCTYLHMLFVF